LQKGKVCLYLANHQKNMRVYFDNAATTKIAPEVLEEMWQVMQKDYGNPSSTHAEGRKARTLIENARKTIAKHLNCSVSEIFFTSGGTESNNMAIKCAVRDLGVRRILSSPLEHHCVLHSLDRVQIKENVAVHYLPVDAQGRIDLEQLEALLKEEAPKTLVSLMHANNEIGTVLDIEKVSRLCREYGALFHSDTVQTTGHFPIDLQALSIDFISGSAHKFNGPKGVGFIYINAGVKIGNFIDGGGQERNMRGGTENIGGIVGLAKAFDLACTHMEVYQSKISALRDYFKKSLIQTFEDISFNGWQEGTHLYTVLNVSFPANEKSDLLLLHLDIAGISASGGSACSSGTDTGSHVLRALDPNTNRKSIRFSFSHENTLEEVNYVLEKLKELFPEQLKKEKSLTALQ
jgi:cysteine desulfurase